MSVNTKAIDMRRTNYNRVQSFPSPEADTASPLWNQFEQSSAPKLENLHQLQGPRLSADHLLKILDAAMVSQKMGMKLAMDGISPVTSSNQDWKFINCYLHSTVLLLEACNKIQLRLESIRNCLASIPIGLHYLEGEKEPSKAILQQAAIVLESSRFVDKRQYSKMGKTMSGMKKLGRKLSGLTMAYQDDTNYGISPELYKALNDSWEMAVLAIGVLSSATSGNSLKNPSFQHLKVEPRTILLTEPNNKAKVFQKKIDKTVSMEELATTDLASQTMLKLISAWQKGGSSNLRRMALKAVAGELRRRKDVLEKTLPVLEDKIEEFYQQIVAIRISMFGLLPKAQKEEWLEMVTHSSYEKGNKNTIHAPHQRSVAWAKVKSKVIARAALARLN